ncbi:MAG TPA: polysaccharide deacetylase family protein [Candidatus Paceibacterota bacterium]|nr:polysaccharide deacetylase family protein [Candidatus Paceibacterota bacterium]
MTTIITTSWDDGDALDERLSDLLDRYGVKGTFYIARDYRKHRIADDVIKRIAQHHEIGAHTLTHPNLMQISPEKRRQEIEWSKAWLEDIVGKEVPLFCYPGGKFDDAVVEAVRAAGFRGARTTQKEAGELSTDPFRFGVSVTLYPKPFTQYDHAIAGYRRLLEPLGTGVPNFLQAEFLQLQHSWETYARALFDEVHARSDIFHLYGHSWANTRYGMWPVLERFLAYISKRRDCIYLTNSEMLERLS